MSENKKYQTEVNFKEIFTSPSRWMGLIYVVVLISIIIAGRYYVQHQNYMSDNAPKFYDQNLPERHMDVVQQKGQKQEGVDIMAIGMEPSEELINTGKDLYAANCASCHGDVASMDKVEQVHAFNMANCLSCHRAPHEKMPYLADKVKKGPEDCSACHR